MCLLILSDKTSTLPNGNSDKSEEFNMGLEVQKSKISSPKLSPTENSPNISLKESSSEDSQISSNDETSLNNNIKLEAKKTK